MTPAWPAYRSVSTRGIPLALAVVLVAACGQTEPPQPLPRDLMRDLASARIQPAATAEVAHLGAVTDGAGTVSALMLAAPARLTWPVRFSTHAELEGSVAFAPALAAAAPAAAGVTVRVGVSDARAYEEVFRLLLAPGAGVAWHPVRVDLGAYSGWKWSLFYRPSRTTWQLIVAADPTPGGAVAWRTLRLQKR